MPKFLRQTTTGRIYNYTDALALRSDMVAHPPLSSQAVAGGEHAVKIIDIEYDETHYFVDQGSVPQFNKLIQEHSELKKQNRRLKDDLDGRDMQPSTAAIPEPEAAPQETEQPDAPLPDGPEVMTEEKKAELIYAAIETLVKEGDVSKFTDAGAPKVQQVEMVCDFNISSAERDIAWENFKAAQTK